MLKLNIPVKLGRYYEYCRYASLPGATFADGNTFNSNMDE